MGILNYTSKVSVSQTMGEIQKILNRRGVTRITTVFDEDSEPVGLAFTLTTEYGVRHFEMPIRIDGVEASMAADPTVPKANRTREQAARTAWRIALTYLTAIGALLDAELATLDEVMLPFMVDRHGITAYQAMRNTQPALGS